MKKSLDRLERNLVFQFLCTASAFFLPFIIGWLLLAVNARAASPQEDYISYIEDVSADYNICPELVQAIIERESNWSPDALNGNCTGLMQINAEYHQERMGRLGVKKLEDPYGNILVGIDYLSELFGEYGDVYAVLMFYNAGYSEKYGLGAWEDGRYSDYAVEITERSAELERLHGK